MVTALTGFGITVEALHHEVAIGQHEIDFKYDHALRTADNAVTLRLALKVGCLAFDSTRISAADVDFPVDVVLCLRDRFEIAEHRFEKADLAGISNWWQERLRDSVRELPTDWMDPLMSRVPDPVVVPLHREA